MQHFPCALIRKPDAFGMFMRQNKVITRKCKGIFRHDIEVIAPTVFAAFRKDFNGNGADGVQRQKIRDSHAALLENLALCCLYRRFVVLSAAGNELPLVVIGAMQNTIQRTAVDNLYGIARI